MHRKVTAFEVERYLRERTAKRRAALATLAGDIDADAPLNGWFTRAERPRDRGTAPDLAGIND